MAFRRDGACCRELSPEGLWLALEPAPCPGVAPSGVARALPWSAVTKMCNLDSLPVGTSCRSRPRTEKRWGWLISNWDSRGGFERPTFSLPPRRAGVRPGLGSSDIPFLVDSGSPFKGLEGLAGAHLGPKRQSLDAWSSLACSCVQRYLGVRVDRPRAVQNPLRRDDFLAIVSLLHVFVDL